MKKISCLLLSGLLFFAVSAESKGVFDFWTFHEKRFEIRRADDAMRSITRMWGREATGKERVCCSGYP